MCGGYRCYLGVKAGTTTTIKRPPAPAFSTAGGNWISAGRLFGWLAAWVWHQTPSRDRLELADLDEDNRQFLFSKAKIAVLRALFDL